MEAKGKEREKRNTKTGGEQDGEEDEPAEVEEEREEQEGHAVGEANPRDGRLALLSYPPSPVLVGIFLVLLFGSVWIGRLSRLSPKEFFEQFIPSFTAVSLGAFVAFYLEHKRQDAVDELEDQERRIALRELLERIRENVVLNVQQSAAALEQYNDTLVWQVTNGEFDQEVLQGIDTEGVGGGIDASFWPNTRPLFYGWERRDSTIEAVTNFYRYVESTAENIPVGSYEPLLLPVEENGFRDLDEEKCRALDREIIRYSASVVKAGQKLRNNWDEHILESADLSLAARILEST